MHILYEFIAIKNIANNGKKPAGYFHPAGFG